MTNELQTFTINKTELAVKEYKGQRVVTFKDVDTVHERKSGTAHRNFKTNRNRFVEGVDFFRRNSSEAKSEYGITAPNGLTLITETGYLMLVKSFNDDLAWEVQRALVNGYFKSREPQTAEPSQELAAVILDIKEIKRRIAELSAAKQEPERPPYLPMDNEFLKKRRSFIICMIADLASIYGKTERKILSECYCEMRNLHVDVQEIHDRTCTELNNWSLSVFETLCRDAAGSRALMLAAAYLMDKSGCV